MTLFSRAKAVLFVCIARIVDTAETPITAATYLSEEFFPGLHILEWIHGGSDLAIFPQGRRPKRAKQMLVARGAKGWNSMKQVRMELELILKIPPQEPLQTPWALFDSQGRRLSSLNALRKASVVFLLEIGQWMWPAVRVGFEHKIKGVFKDKPAILRTLALRPAVFEVQHFLSAQETEEIMAIGRKQGLAKSVGILNSADVKRAAQQSEFRTSRQAWLSNSMSPLVQQLDERVSKLTRVHPSHNEAAQLLRYDEGEYYHSHMDWAELELLADPDQKVQWEHHHMGWQDRLGNVFWYLNDVEDGGHTIFPKHGQPICKPETKGGPDARICPGAGDPVINNCEEGLKVYPRRGSVILWYNFHPNGRGDRNSLHAGCPVGRNLTKWSANKWFSIKPVDSPGMWIDDHPAIERFGFMNGCEIIFVNKAGVTVDLIWEGGSGIMMLGSIPDGQTISQNSWKNQRFALWAGSRKSNTISCSISGRRYMLNKNLKLRPSGYGIDRKVQEL